MHFRRTPLRVLAARLAFWEEAVRLLPHLARLASTQLPECFDGINESSQASAFALFAAAERALYGERSVDTRFLQARSSGPDPRSELSALGRPARRARAHAATLKELAAHRPLSAEMPEDVRCDGEISKRAATVLVARRKAWETAGRPLANDAWRTIDLSNAIVSLALPAGGFRLHREAVVGDALPVEFCGVVVLDEALAARGGLYRAEIGVDGVRRFVGLGKRVGVLTVVRALVREHGQFFAEEICRRLRTGASVTFAPARNRFGPARTKVTISGGTKDRAAVARLLARAERLSALADAHGKATARYSEIGRADAAAFSSRPEIHHAEVRARVTQATQDFAEARDHYNDKAAQLCLKAEMAGHPFAVPPARMPKPRASLCDRDRRSISQAEAAFHAAWRELNAAGAQNDSACGAELPVHADQPVEVFSLEYA